MKKEKLTKELNIQDRGRELLNQMDKDQASFEAKITAIILIMGILVIFGVYFYGRCILPNSGVNVCF